MPIKSIVAIAVLSGAALAACSDTSKPAALVPLGSLVAIRDVAGPDLVQRFNLFTTVPVQGQTSKAVSSGTGLDVMERLASETLPPGIGYEWTELAFQERAAGGTATYIFALSVVFVFLVLAALYESWALPLAIILIVPMSVLSAMIGVSFRGMDNNILTQVGFVVLIGLASKNAILIVEFARKPRGRACRASPRWSMPRASGCGPS